jgi:hypothetical protein
VLKPGGRLAVSDTTMDGRTRAGLAQYAGCIAAP